MWRARKLNTYEILDEKTNRIVATGLEEAQAQAICDKHNNELNGVKWNKGGPQNEPK